MFPEGVTEIMIGEETPPDGSEIHTLPDGRKIMFPEGVTEIMIGEETPSIPEGEGETYMVPPGNAHNPS